MNETEFYYANKTSTDLYSIITNNKIQSYLELMTQRQNFSLMFFADDDSFDIFKQPFFDNFSYSQFEEKRIIHDELHHYSAQSQEVALQERDLHQQAEVEEAENNQAGEGQFKRADNTIFKTSLSQYRKSLIDCLKGWAPDWIFEEIKKIYGYKNMSIFPKLNFMVRQLNISNQVTQRWLFRSQVLAAKKQQLVARGKYCKKRLQELQNSIEAMNFCMSEPFFEVGFQRYWGNYKQQGKFTKSKEEVRNYFNYFKNLLKENSSHTNIQSNISQYSTRKFSIESLDSSSPIVHDSN